MLKSLKNRILTYFLLIAFAIASIVFPLNFIHEQKELSVRNSLFNFGALQTLFAKDLRHTSEFLSFESTNPRFFITGESASLDAHKQLQDSIRSILSLEKEISEDFLPEQNLHLQKISETYAQYCAVFDSMVYLLYKRGYRDFGLEGEMISYIYKAEKMGYYRDQIFKLRKNEREYLNRNDSTYLVILEVQSADLIKEIARNKRMPDHDQTVLIRLLNDYRNSITHLASLDNSLGLRTNTGLRKQLFSIADRLDSRISHVLHLAKDHEQAQMARLNTVFGLISILLLVSAVIASMYLSRHLVNPLEKLTRYISHLAEGNFRYNEKLNLRSAGSEVRKIYGEFRNMVAQLRIREIQRDDALNEAKDNEKRYRELADLLPQSIFETDKLGNLMYVNKTWLTTFGYSEEDLKSGLNLIEILQTDTENKILTLNRVENTDFIALCKDGTRFPAVVYSDTIYRNEEYAGRRGIIIDVTLRNQYIEALQKEKVRAITSDKHKSSFLANMSHEIRTPMNSIIGFANLLGAEQVEPDQKKEFVEYIQSSGQVLLNLIDDIIDVAKIEAGELKIKSEECQPAMIVKELQKTFEGYKLTLGKSEIDLISDIPNENIKCKADGFRLRQILSNLISNAIKFTEKGQVKITFRKKNERVLEFSVEDTGMGMSQNDLRQIFNRYKRTHRSEGIKGTGLGLSISKNLIELLGGQMWVSSEEGKGSRFWFEIPFVRIPGQVYEENQQEHDKNTYRWNNRRFLVAEDDDKSFLYLEGVLKATGAELIRAVNGREVVEAIRFTNEIDCVLMDIQMPILNGYDATREIKEIAPRIPVIAQTAYAMDGDKEKSIMAGCDDYITKPIDPGKLLAKIDQFLQKSPSPSEPITDWKTSEKVKDQTKIGLRRQN